MNRSQRLSILSVFAIILTCNTLINAQQVRLIPQSQDKPPGPALSPEEAIRKMVVPEGFAVELVAAEPDLINPVAMTIDERGRFWVAESVEYPRHPAGRGRDRIKILEDSDGDGKIDRVSVFADGLNIPCGIAVGYGGVWVSNSPDILYYPIASDGKTAGAPQVVVTGFGRHDTHEMPNTFTWGPDGWLYGLNGVFNPSVVKSNNGKTYRFTCALFRIHPKTREFQIVCEGTSNPWGLTWDAEGSAFVSACVIDHLWHLTETGYYHRQGGPYPPYTWVLESIVKHRHQKAAYCGLHYFDSDAYPEQYRDKLFMGNIHGGCINVDRLERNGSTYLATAQPDFLVANDAWFMPIVQKTGPDGSLYILDWYDRYHCYQDAGRDPAGIDRSYGRLYRVRYKDTPRAEPFDLAEESDDQLIERLKSPNVYFRDLAQRLLCERNLAETRKKLESFVLDDGAPRKARMHALWSLIGTGSLDDKFHLNLLSHDDPAYRAWGIRAAGNYGTVVPAIRDRVVTMAGDGSPDVKLQVAIAARKISGIDAMSTLVEVLANCGDDKLIPAIVWQNLQPLLKDEGGRYVQLLEQRALRRRSQLTDLSPRVAEILLAADIESATALYELLLKQADTAVIRPCLARLAEKLIHRELKPAQISALQARLESKLEKIVSGAPDQPLYFEAALVAGTWKHAAATEWLQQVAASSSQSEPRRKQALELLISVRDPRALGLAEALVSDRKLPVNSRAAVLAALAEIDDPKVAEMVLRTYGKFEPELQPKAIDLLTRRTSWSKVLLEAIGRQELPRSVLSANQAAALLARNDAELSSLVKSRWGTVRTQRDPQREQFVAQMRTLVKSAEGDPHQGVAVFKRVCGQCHKIYGEGSEVGPDLTANGRNDFEQLLSNVFDPSLVIGAAYQGVTIITVDGQSFSGLVAEDSDTRVVLKLAGGTTQTIPRAEIETFRKSELSLMPEGVEKQLKAQEIIDLFSFLALDKPPGDPSAKRLAGSQPAGK
jgi:putative heme-binding domain-containing protein